MTNQSRYELKYILTGPETHHAYLWLMRHPGLYEEYAPQPLL